jgi:hypothetical protein
MKIQKSFYFSDVFSGTKQRERREEVTTYLGVIDIGAVGDDGEEGENEGEYGGDTCPNGNAGAT